MRRHMTIITVIMLLGIVLAIARGAEAATKTESAADTLKDTTKKAVRELNDSWLTLKTKLALLADERVSSSGVHVTTHQGVIVLDGKVDSEVARHAAEEIATNIEGVDRVENRLVIVAKADQKVVARKDDQIVKDVDGLIKKNADLKKAEIEIRADNGIVTLTGEAPSLETSVHASEVASRVPGVRAVRNELIVDKPANNE
jgi:hyperosmotically inducible periplasmic protein